MKLLESKYSSWIIGIPLFILLSIITVSKTNFSAYSKIIIVGILVALYVFNEIVVRNKIATPFKKDLIKTKLSTIDQFLCFDQSQMLRANIFKLNKKTKCYYIEYQYNMDNFSDKAISIPVNKGCTGEAWLTKNQIWGDQHKIFSEGSFNVPKEQYNKVPTDLIWICSTPIVKKDQVIAVMNFDGNKPMSAIQQLQIQKYCHRLVEEIKEII